MKLNGNVRFGLVGLLALALGCMCSTAQATDWTWSQVQVKYNYVNDVQYLLASDAQGVMTGEVYAEFCLADEQKTSHYDGLSPEDQDEVDALWVEAIAAEVAFTDTFDDSYIYAYSLAATGTLKTAADDKYDHAEASGPYAQEALNDSYAASDAWGSKCVEWSNRNTLIIRPACDTAKAKWITARNYLINHQGSGSE